MRRDRGGGSGAVRHDADKPTRPPPPAWAANASATTSGRDLGDAGHRPRGQRERVRSGREGAHRHRHDRHPGGVRRAHPVRRVLDRGAPRRVGAEPPRDLEVDVGRGLAARHLLARTATTRITSSSPVRSSTSAMTGAFDDDASPSGQCSPSAPDRLDRAGQQRQPAPVARDQPLARRRRRSRRAPCRLRARRARRPTTPSSSSRASRAWPRPSTSRRGRRRARGAPRPSAPRSRRARRRGRARRRRAPGAATSPRARAAGAPRGSGRRGRRALDRERPRERRRDASTPSALRLEEGVDRLVGRGVRARPAARARRRAGAPRGRRRARPAPPSAACAWPTGSRSISRSSHVEPQRLAEPEERARDLLDRAPGLARDRDDVGRVAQRAAGRRERGPSPRDALLRPARRDPPRAPRATPRRRATAGSPRSRWNARRPSVDLRAQVEPGLGVAQVPAGGRLDERGRRRPSAPTRAAVDRPAEPLDRLPAAAAPVDLARDRGRRARRRRAGRRARP